MNSTEYGLAAAEYWYRHRTTAGNIFRDSKLGAALRQLPSGYAEISTAWMRVALLAASMAGWLHQLTAATRGEAILEGHGARGGKAMIATVRRRLIAVPARLVRHAGQLILRLPPGPPAPDVGSRPYGAGDGGHRRTGMGRGDLPHLRAGPRRGRSWG
jgi:hypothetical protein